MKYFHLITGKKDTPKDKDPPEGNQLLSSSEPLLKVIPLLSIASCNGKVRNQKVLKQSKQFVTKNCYTKLIPAQRYKIGKKGAEMGVTAAVRYNYYYIMKFSDLALTEPTVR